MKLSPAAFLLLPALAAATGVRPEDYPRSGVRSRRLVPTTPEAETQKQRDLMAGMSFAPLTCNDWLSASDCDPATTLSTILAATPAGTTPVIPCGTCALLDVADGSTIELPDGLNVEGMLHVPSTANVKLVTTHVFVQGIWKIDPPADPANTVRVRLVGTEDKYLVPHAENAMSSGCDPITGCNVGKKGIVVAGGLLDIRALPDETCPTWTTLKSVVPPEGSAVSSPYTGCPLDHDLVKGDGTFASGSLEGFGQYHANGASLAVTTDDDGNSYLRQGTRNYGNRNHRLTLALDPACADPASHSNNGGKYRFKMRYRANPPYAGPGRTGADGCPTGGTSHTDTCRDPSVALAVDCCAGSGDDGSLTCARPGCLKLNFLDAKAHCESEGMRLCTAAELGSGACCGKGCQFNSEMVWTEDECVVPEKSPDNGDYIPLWIHASGKGRYLAGCPPPIDNEWVECTQVVTLKDYEAASGSIAVAVENKAPAWKTIDYDDFSFEAIPRPHKIRVSDPRAAACFGARPGSEVLITNSNSQGGWQNQLVRTVGSVDPVTGEIDFGPLGFVGTNPSVDPDTASEVAWLSRSVVFEAEGDGGPSGVVIDGVAPHGGHLMIFHTPNVAQRIEGIEFRNFGQQGILGRYPVHFHKSWHVAGSVVRKNSIRDSKQRCVVIHGSHDVLVEENVAFNTYGHCYILEDGVETNNSFVGNLGARTRKARIGIGSSDGFASTIWITNPINHFVGNVCAGSQDTGVWFELRRGNNRFFRLGTFKDNTAHSNSMGIKTYQVGFNPPVKALFEGIRSYYNGVGLFLHGTSNVKVKDAFFAHTSQGVLYFDNRHGNSIETSTFVGSCWAAGILFSLEKRSSQIRVYNSTFTGYANKCDDGKYGAPIVAISQLAQSEYDMPILSGLTIDSNEAHAIDIQSPFVGRSIYLEDPTGEYNPSGLPGFYINDQPHMTEFMDEGLCSPLERGNSHGLFCQGACLRRLLVDTYCCAMDNNGMPKMDYRMVVTSKSDPSKQWTFNKSVRESGRWRFSYEFDVVLPADEYNLRFLRVSDGQIDFPHFTLRFRDEVVGDGPPSCSGYITTASFDFGVEDFPSAAPSLSIMPTVDLGYKFVGCFADDEERDLPVGFGTGHTPDQCYEKCSSSGYGYFGLQWEGACWCGSTYGVYGETECHNNCVGPNYGGWQNCVYNIKGVGDDVIKTPDNNGYFVEVASDLVSEEGSLVFEVQAKNDAHIVVGPSTVQYTRGRVVPGHYEIGLGGWANSKSVMRLEPDSSYHADEFYGSVLSEHAWRTFKITWDASALKVEQWSGVNWSELMQMARDDRSIDRAMVMTGWGATGLWNFTLVEF